MSSDGEFGAEDELKQERLWRESAERVHRWLEQTAHRSLVHIGWIDGRIFIEYRDEGTHRCVVEGVNLWAALFIAMEDSNAL